MKFTYEAGSRVGRGVEGDLSTALLLGGDPTGADVRWVTLPPVLGGDRAYVVARKTRRCLSPGCNRDHAVLFLNKKRHKAIVIDTPIKMGKDVEVATLTVWECGDQFLWGWQKLPE